MSNRNRPFDITYVRRLVPGDNGLQEEQELNLSLTGSMLDHLAEVDPIELKVFIALALNTHPLGGREFQELLRLGVVEEAWQGRMAAVFTQTELGRLAGVDRRTADRYCRDLAKRGWLIICDVPREAQGRFSGGRLYLLASAEIVYTYSEPSSSNLQIEQRDYMAPCTSDVHGAMQKDVIFDNFAQRAKNDMPPCTSDVQGCTSDVHGGPLMEKEIGKRKGKGAANFMSSHNAEEQIPLASGILLVLDHFVSQVSKRWPTGADQGQSPAPERYEIAPALLSSPVAPAAVAQAPADLVEELWLLSQVLQMHGPAGLCAVIDRVLEQDARSPCRRLAVIWPNVPGAVELKRNLACNRREGERLHSGYREARRLFILLNRFGVGPPLLAAFLEMCREAGVPRVLQALRRALQDGREYVTLEFLRRSLAAEGDPPSGPVPAEAAGDRETRSDGGPPPTEGGVLRRLADSLHALGTFQDREQAPALLRKLRQTGLPWDVLERCVDKAREEAMECRGGLRRFYQALQEAVVQAVGPPQGEV